MSDIDRQTFAVIDNFASALQGVETILSTRLGSRVMRREFGGGVVELLGRNVTAALFAAFQQLIATAIDLWEPRFSVRRITPQGSVEDIRAGRVGFLFEVDYRPRGHLGDFTVERVVQFSLLFRDGIQVNYS
ncbi:GPW/gp25 family protein [Oricola indica]|jgi:phage baseplate assembly protein W|uniref:GPW/gp25 family protein n=1 Tax=Oricola indica TaxID=2872591 RepID=UPI001CBB9D4B|nr:GPW/gp25 family protein [Oricola indica]